MTRIWWILIWALEFLKISFLIVSFCAKYITLDLKKYREVTFHAMKSDAKFEEKLTSGLENDLRNKGNFHQSTWMSQNWDLDGIF